MPIDLSSIIPFTRRMWVRIVAIAALALVSVGLTSVLQGVLPDWLTDWVGAGAVDRLLGVMSNSMLAAIVFTLSVMVTLHRAVASTWTPRAHRLMVQDNVTLNAVAVFIGGWVYALAAVALRESGVIERDETAFLFLTTVLVLTLLIVVLVRWAVHLVSLGSLEETGELIERAAREGVRERGQHPGLRGSVLTPDMTIPEGYRQVLAEVTGWVAAVDVKALGTKTAERGLPIYVTVPPGRFVAAGTPIGMAPPELHEAVVAAVRIAELRDYTQDPRFGVLALSEVAQRALSPGVNDPGTAIEIVGRLLRVMLDFGLQTPEPPEHPLVFLPPVSLAGCVNDAFAAIARDGAAHVEVQHHVLNALVCLMAHPDAELATAARREAEIALRRSERAMDEPTDLERLRSLVPSAVRASAA